MLLTEPFDDLVPTLQAVVAVATPITEETARSFDDYCRSVRDLQESRIVANNLAISWHSEGTTFGRLDAQESSEAFESMCVRFRRLWLLAGDSTFVQVRSTLRKHLRSGIGAHSDTAIAWVDDLKRRNKALGQTWTFMGFDLKPRAAMELVFHGNLFHRDIEKRDDLAQLAGWRFMLVPGIAEQIWVMSRLYGELAFAVGAILGCESLVPHGFDPAFSVSGLGEPVTVSS